MSPISSRRLPVTAAGLIHGWLGVLEDSEPTSREHLHASLALLPVDPRQADYLSGRLFISSPSDVSVLREAVRPLKDP